MPHKPATVTQAFKTNYQNNIGKQIFRCDAYSSLTPQKVEAKNQLCLLS